MKVKSFPLHLINIPSADELARAAVSRDLVRTEVMCAPDQRPYFASAETLGGDTFVCRLRVDKTHVPAPDKGNVPSKTRFTVSGLLFFSRKPTATSPAFQVTIKYPARGQHRPLLPPTAQAKPAFQLPTSR